MPAGTRARVLVVGGGFGGVLTARRLGRADADVTLLDRGTSHVFQPLLYQCATGLLSEGQITSPLRVLLHKYRNVRVVRGEACAIDTDRTVVTAARVDGTTFELPYDYLVVAVGMQPSYFGNAEIARHAPGMKTIDDALGIRRRILGAFEMAESLTDEAEIRSWLTFAVAGAGPTGVELAGQIREISTRTLHKEFVTIDPRMTRVLLFDGSDAVLGSFGPKLAAKSQSILNDLGVETHLGVLVDKVDDEGLETKAKDGTLTRYEARSVFWTAGVEAVPFVARVAEATGVRPDRQGRIAVQPDLTIPGHPGIWVIGDNMSYEGLPGVAETAMQGGIFVAGQIRAAVQGSPRRDAQFHYRDLGSAAYISRYHGVLKAGPLMLSGFLGWLLWGAIHIAFLAGVRNRFGAVTTWLLALGRNKRRERAVTYRDTAGGIEPTTGLDIPAKQGNTVRSPAPGR